MMDRGGVAKLTIDPGVYFCGVEWGSPATDRVGVMSIPRVRCLRDTGS